MWDMLCLQSILWSFPSILMFSGHYFLFPNDPAYLYQILTNLLLSSSTNCDGSMDTAHFVLFSIYGLLNTFFVIRMQLTLTFVTDLLFLFFFVLAQLISQELRIKIKRSYKTSRNFRRSENLMKFYRTLQILLKYYTESFGLLTMVGHVLMLQMSVYSLTSLITHWGKLSVLTRAILSVCFFLGNAIWLFSLDILGKLVSESEKTIRSWRRLGFLAWECKSNLLVMKKFRKSCKPLMIVYGNLYFVKRSTVLSFVKLTSNVTLRALFAIHK